MGVPPGGFVHLTVVSRPNSLPLPFRTPATQVRVWLKRSLLPSSTAKTGDLELTRSAKMEERNDGDLTSMSYEDFLPYLADVHTKNKTALELII